VGAARCPAHLLHIGLAVFGEGQAWYRGELLPGAEALRRAGIAAQAPVCGKGTR
jgi:histidine ammonia-lyase